MAKQAVVVKRYSSEKEYQQDANKMAKQGYVVDNVVAEDKGRSGCSWFALGIFNFLRKKKVEYVVTYKLVEGQTT